MTLFLIVKETKDITVTSVCKLTGTPHVAHCKTFIRTHILLTTLIQTHFSLSLTKVMLYARRFVLTIYARKHQVRKVKRRNAGNVGFRTQSHSSKEAGQGWLTKYVWGMRERDRYRERERGRGRSEERKGERGDRSRGDLALISVRTTGWLWVEKGMMEANKVLHFVPSGKIHMHSHTYTHTHAHICTCSCAVTTEHLRVPWNLRLCVLNMCREGACVFVCCCKFSLCWVLQVCGLFFSHAAAAAAGVFWGALCWNADGLFRGWFSGMRRKCFYAVNLSRVNRKKEKMTSHTFRYPHTHCKSMRTQIQMRKSET